MSFVAGTTTIPIAAGLIAAVALFLAWSVFAVRSERAEVEVVDARTAVPAPTPAVTVQVVLRPHYEVAAPDADAVFTAMAHRVRTPLAFPTPGRRDRRDRQDRRDRRDRNTAASLPRSA